MGAVYRATDTELGREVALKILPERFVRDRQRMSRFQREAEVLAYLNHPNISIIHGLEEADGVRALVLELVEGPTLAERIAEGPIPVEDALKIALEIAHALETAHEKGIIHRDLKPANVKITPEGKVKVLDFGLAKALETDVSHQESANSPTLTLEVTQEGLILGTTAYMSPEQARGQVVDKRTDIWSFGLLLFEMLTGKGMFSGKSFTETPAAVIHRELPEDTPLNIRELVERCLRKDPRMRLRDMGDARIRIGECLGGEVALEEPIVPLTSLPLRRRLVPWAAVPILVILAWFMKAAPPAPDKEVSRWEITGGEGQAFYHQHRTGVALSPDGSLLAFVADSDGKQPTVYLRSLDRWGSVRLSEDIAAVPFFSPDGEWLGAGVRSEDGSRWDVKKYPIKGGTPTTICRCKSIFGASWAADDSVVVACNFDGGLERVSALGGKREALTELDKEAGEVAHWLPHVIPGANAVLFTVLRHSIVADWKNRDIAVQSLETGERKLLIKQGSDARYVPSGHLVFAREGTLWAVPFDRTELAVTGPEFPILEGVSQALNTNRGTDDTGAAQFAVSLSGSLAYIAGSVAPDFKREIIWVDRDGRTESIGIEQARYHIVRLSPDRSRVALDKGGQIWTYDLDRRALTIRTSEGGSTPTWSPDGAKLVFGSHRHRKRNLFSMAVDGAARAEQLFPSELYQAIGSWSLDGTFAFSQAKSNSQNDHDIWTLPMDGSGPAQPFLATDSFEASPEFSPDGRWLAYVSNETGRMEVFVQRYPEKGRKELISTAGGLSPVWSGSGDELFYLTSSGSRTKYWAVDIKISGDTLKAGNPAFLFEKECLFTFPHRSYDVDRDGQRFLMVSQNRAKERAMRREYFGTRINIVLKWSEELRRLAPNEQ